MSLLFLLAGSLSLQAQTAQSLQVMVNQIPDAPASTWVAVYGSGTQFLNAEAEPIARMAIPSGQDRGSVTFDNLLAGEYYAIIVFQDINGNGQLDRRNGRPAESFAYSERESYTGTPTFSDLAFRLNPEISAILLRVQPVRYRATEENLSSR